MSVYEFDPLSDSRWAAFVRRHPHTSIFHTQAWLEALKRSYRYAPVAFTTSASGSELRNALVFCEVRSWLTGNRLVSLPFSDHCDPLVESPSELDSICGYLEQQRRRRGWTYIELRPSTQTLSDDSAFAQSERFWLHQLDLTPSETNLYRSFAKDSIQRKIRRAGRDRLHYHEGGGELLEAFYELLVLTRRRHQLPPQPLQWFRNLVACFGSALKVRVATLDGRAVAAIVTLCHGDTTVYKYGASDAAFHPFGGMQLLFWRAIQDARRNGHRLFDFGRSDIQNDGLKVFKDRWGTARSALTYWRYPAAQSSTSSLRRYAMAGAKQVLDYVPNGCRAAAGRLLYRHAG